MGPFCGFPVLQGKIMEKMLDLDGIKGPFQPKPFHNSMMGRQKIGRSCLFFQKKNKKGKP